MKKVDGNLIIGILEIGNQEYFVRLKLLIRIQCLWRVPISKKGLASYA